MCTLLYEICASLTGRNLKLEFDKILIILKLDYNNNLKLFLDSLRENRASFKNLEEELDL